MPDLRAPYYLHYFGRLNDEPKYASLSQNPTKSNHGIHKDSAVTSEITSKNEAVELDQTDK